MLNGQGYLNIHTDFWPMGEIRGQLPPIAKVPSLAPWSAAVLGLSLAALGLGSLRR